MALGDAHVFCGFVTPIQTTVFLMPPAVFLTCFRGERRNTPERKFALSQLGIKLKPPVHESDTLTTEPPGWRRMEFFF